MGQDIYNPASVFSYFSPFYGVPGTGGLVGPEFEINNPNNAILRENLIGGFFAQYSESRAEFRTRDTRRPHVVPPACEHPRNACQCARSHIDARHHARRDETNDRYRGNGGKAPVGSLYYQVQTACYLILTSSYYNVWH